MNKVKINKSKLAEILVYGIGDIVDSDTEGVLDGELPDDGTSSLGWRMYPCSASASVRGSRFEDFAQLYVGEIECFLSVNPSSLWATVCAKNGWTPQQIDPELLEFNSLPYNGRTLGEIVSDELDLELKIWKSRFLGEEQSLVCSYQPEMLPDRISAEEFEEIYRRAVLRVMPKGGVDFNGKAEGYALDSKRKLKERDESAMEWLEFVVFEEIQKANTALLAYEWLPVTRYSHQYAFTKLVAGARGWNGKGNQSGS